LTSVLLAEPAVGTPATCRREAFRKPSAALPLRSNCPTIGHDEAGQKIAGLYWLVATCEAHAINPRMYLKANAEKNA
jgi:hypothetical protein